jgi:hypothetical protein
MLVGLMALLLVLLLVGGMRNILLLQVMLPSCRLLCSVCIGLLLILLLLNS